MTQSYTLHPIGYVRSPFKNKNEILPWGAPAEIDILPHYAPALTGLERSSHLFVIGFFHEASRNELFAKQRDRGQEPTLGVFSCRSPARPNPLSLTVTRLLGIQDTTLEVESLDLLDGTPIMDLKPYNPGWDDVFCAERSRRLPPSALFDHELLCCLRRNLIGYVGSLATSPFAETALAAVFCAVRHFGRDPRDPDLRVVTSSEGVALDTLIGLLGASFASGRLCLMPVGKQHAAPLHFLFSCHGEELKLVGLPTLASQKSKPDSDWSPYDWVAREGHKTNEFPSNSNPMLRKASL